MKKCSLCQKEKSKENFNKNSSKKDGLQNVCRFCNKQRAKVYYEKNHKHARTQTTIRKNKLIKENQKKLWDLFINSSCVDCGNDDPMVLEFDHIKSKSSSISRLLCEGYSWERIAKEIKKCAIRCANCHNKKTHKEKNTYRWRFLKKSKQQ